MNAEREDFHELIGTVLRECPDIRIGQLMAIVGELCVDMHGRGLGDAEDDELLEALWQFHRDALHAHAVLNPTASIAG